MKVKIFDEMHEKDLEESINGFLGNLNENDEVIDIKYEVVLQCFLKNKYIVLVR